jgi:hypothetical protein
VPERGLRRNAAPALVRLAQRFPDGGSKFDQVRRVVEGTVERLAAFRINDDAVEPVAAHRPRNQLPINFIVFKVNQPHPHLFDAHEVTYRRGIRQRQ